MNIGKIIKKLRREREMTQEDLAQILSISPQAVSRWECGDGLPDLSLIPALCSLFDTTADNLLGINIEQKKEKIEEIITQAYTYSDRGYFTEAKEVLQAGLVLYPNSEELLTALMFAWYNESDEVKTEEERLRCHAESLALGEKLLEISTNDDTRQSAIQILCYTYDYCGEHEKARTLAEKMPVMCIAQESLMARITHGTENYHALLNERWRLLDMLLMNMPRNPVMDDGNWAYSEDEQELLREKSIAFLQQMIEDGNYGFFHTRLIDLFVGQARHFAGKQDGARTLEGLENAANHALGFLDYAKQAEFEYTSLLFRGKKEDGNKFSTGSSDNDAAELLDTLQDPCFDFVRDSDAFAEIVRRLEPHAGKWEVE